jgi:hypothetical protein
MYYHQRWFSLFCGVRRWVSVGGWLVTGCGRLWGVVWPARFGAEGIGANIGGRLFFVIRRNLCVVVMS